MFGAEQRDLKAAEGWYHLAVPDDPDTLLRQRVAAPDVGGRLGADQTRAGLLQHHLGRVEGMVEVGVEDDDGLQLRDARAAEAAGDQVAVRRELGEERAPFTRPGEEAVGEDGALAVAEEQGRDAEESHAQAEWFFVGGRGHVILLWAEVGTPAGAADEPRGQRGCGPLRDVEEVFREAHFAGGLLRRQV